MEEELEFSISNGSVDMVEMGWQEIEITHNGVDYTLEFETTETTNDSGRFSSVCFATDESEEISKEIGFEITDDFKSELYHQWQSYSNNNFRG